MAALLVSLAVMSVLMTVALPVWRNQAQREKEAELVFRGEQYARAIALYRAKNGNQFPPNIDVLVQGKFLRKKYLDPVTKKDFDIIVAGAQPTNTQGGQATPGRGGTQPGTGRGPAAPVTPQSPSSPSSATQQLTAAGIMGVHSKSQETSIKIYKGQNRYDLWAFVFTAVNRPGGNTPGGEGAAVPGGRGAVNPGGPGGPGRGRGGRGTEPGGRGRGMDFPMPPIRGGGPGGNPIIRNPGGF
jgi:type II secretory pathway pseudopilin PulG